MKSKIAAKIDIFYHKVVMKHIGKNKIFCFIQTILYLNVEYKVTFQSGCQLRFWCQQENIFAFVTLGYCSKCLQKQGGGVSFRFIKVY